MKLHLLSDLHLERGFPFSPGAAASVADLIVLAGDIHEGLAGLTWAAQAFPGKEVIYIPGNHEYYEHNYDTLLADLARLAKDLGIKLGHKLSVSYATETGPVRLLASTLWTDFNLRGLGNLDMLATAGLNDFTCIHRGDDLITPTQMRGLFEAEAAWLHLELQKATQANERIVVATHFGPSKLIVDSKRQITATTSYFTSDLEWMMRDFPVEFWLYGHTHSNVLASIRQCQLISNQRGYMTKSKAECKDFDKDFLLTI